MLMKNGKEGESLEIGRFGTFVCELFPECHLLWKQRCVLTGLEIGPRMCHSGVTEGSCEGQESVGGCGSNRAMVRV